MAVNVDLGFVLSLLDLFSLSDSSSLLEVSGCGLLLLLLLLLLLFTVGTVC